MHPIVLIVLLIVAVAAGLWTGRRLEALSSRKPKSLAGRAKDMAARRMTGWFRSLVGRNKSEDDAPD